VITRVVDYGGLFFDDLLPGQELPAQDHRRFRPAEWVSAGRRRMEGMRAIAQRHGLTMMQLACQWNLAHESVTCVAPTLIQELGDDARPVEEKRAELAGLGPELVLTAEDVEEIRALGDNTGTMALKGASLAHTGDERPDAWELDERLGEVAARWGIAPERDLALSA
jgi:aryl-alcohol dehydrogenase-like predicted oxidoreductase